jgi:predicted nucleic acid-binding protein
VIAVVDTGPLYAAADADDADHESCVAALATPGLRLVVPALVVAEATYLVGTRLGPRAEAAFLRGLDELAVDAPVPEDWPRIADLVEQYAAMALGGTDASVVALAERLASDTLVTLDRRHFRSVRPRHCAAFRLLPS